ncbi:ABC transporter ATP-binding protein [Desulfuromonas acetoxidans]|uniref:ABC transporter ATP-binding protein n=1 Tax=Desulfuromonas acetoxidans TaxID=891 RepID=UPI00292EDB5D
MSEIFFKSVSKTYKTGLFKKRVRALSELDLHVPAGDVYGLIGPNGAGKSSAVRLLLKLTRPDCGAVEIVESNTGVTRNILENVGYLPENPYLYDHLSLFELLCFAASVAGLSQDVAEPRISFLSEKLGIAHALRRRLKTFSKGMRQRAGFCFALLHDPDLVVLDEPMSGLDPLGRKMVCELIAELKGQGKTVFFCSHILSDVERLCDRVAILHRGRIVRQFDADDLIGFRDGTRNLENEFVTAVGGVS